MKTEPLKILLVDDTPENLVALEALLRRADLELVTARSGAEALEQCLKHDLALALVDVQMPEIDGFELAELMRGAERTKHVPIIFVTAGARDHERVFRGYESGAVDFLYKPLDPHILTLKVNVFLELAQQQRRLAQELRINEMFMGILGHDLRNPLAALVAGIDVLSLRHTDPNDVRVLDRMRSSGKRMQEMIEELLDLTRARLVPGLGLARSREALDLRELLARTIDELRVTHDREIVLEGAESAAASGDPERLLQLFSNLLANALVHGKAGTPVTARITRDDGAYVVDIHNEGAIPRDVLATLFEPFRRPRGSGRGLGLGLYIAKQIAEAHGGDVTAHTAEPTGTVFTVRIPSGPSPGAAGSV
jgi:two-component system, sensor histidine kinase and response regulator